MSTVGALCNPLSAFPGPGYTGPVGEESPNFNRLRAIRRRSTALDILSILSVCHLLNTQGNSMKIIHALMLLLLSVSAIADNANEFESATVGFKVTKPNDWQFVTAEENLENLRNIRMNDKEFHQLMLKYSTAPLVAMMKHPEPFDDLNPSFKVNIKPLGQFKGSDPKQILHMLVPQFEKMFQDFSLVQPPKEVKVAGLDAAYIRINYSLAIPDGRLFPTASELWIVPRGDYFFFIGAGTRQDEKTGTRAEIKDILSSVVIKQ